MNKTLVKRESLVAVLLGAAILMIQPIPVLAIHFIEIIEKEIVEENHNQFGFQLEQFNQLVFNNQVELGGARKQLLNRLQLESDSLQSICQLAEEQKEKLLLAGRGDIHTFVQEYARLHEKFAADLKKQDQQALQNIWSDISPLRNQYNGKIFGQDSFFKKVLGGLLNEEQVALLEQLRREQNQFLYRTAIMQFIQQFDQVAPLTHKKRKKLLDLFEQHTLPPKSTTGSNLSHYFSYYLCLQMKGMPEEELRPLFGERAWKSLQQQMMQAKAMERQLQNQGLVPDQEDEFTRLKDA